ncbi:MAG: type II toxin-antitoxin system HicB family antitoxin [Dissulfurispiraceae bacterium]
MAKEFTVIIERDEDGYYVSEVPELRGCHTQAKSLDKLMERTKEAIQLCLELAGAGKDRPSTHIVGVQKIAI